MENNNALAMPSQDAMGIMEAEEIKSLSTQVDETVRKTNKSKEELDALDRSLCRLNDAHAEYREAARKVRIKMERISSKL